MNAKPVEDDPQLPGLDVLVDEDRQRLARPLRAVRALQVGVLDERHRRLGRAEGYALLLDPGEERLDRPAAAPWSWRRSLRSGWPR